MDTLSACNNIMIKVKKQPKVHGHTLRLQQYHDKGQEIAQSARTHPNLLLEMKRQESSRDFLHCQCYFTRLMGPGQTLTAIPCQCIIISPSQNETITRAMALAMN